MLMSMMETKRKGNILDDVIQASGRSKDRELTDQPGEIGNQKKHITALPLLLSLLLPLYYDLSVGAMLLQT